MKTILFSDIDGTILNSEYKFKIVDPKIKQLLNMGVSFVFCSSKTRAEIEFYRKSLGIPDPFIIENGAAIIVPKNYFPDNDYEKSTICYDNIEIGIPYPVLRQKLQAIKNNTNFQIVGFGDMTAKEISKDSRLPIKLAKLAKQREYDEPLRIVAGNEEQFVMAAEAEGLSVVKGDRYWHLKGLHNKGTAVKILINLYRVSFGQIRTVGVGNGPNDLPMLSAVEKSFWVDNDEHINDVWVSVLDWVSGSN